MTKTITAQQINYYQSEGRDATLRVSFNNGVELDITGDSIRINYKDRFELNISEAASGEGYNKPYDMVVVHPNGWRAKRDLTAYNYSREFGNHDYPPMTEEEMTKRAIEGFDGCFVVTDKTAGVKRHEQQRNEALAVTQEKQKK